MKGTAADGFFSGKGFIDEPCTKEKWKKHESNVQVYEVPIQIHDDIWNVDQRREEDDIASKKSGRWKLTSLKNS